MDRAAFVGLLGESPLHLLHRLLQISIDIYNEEVGETAITQRQFAILRALDDKDGISQSQLGEAAGMDRSTLAEVVARMVGKGLLRRERSKTDRRVNLLWLAAGGRLALNGLLPQVKAANDRILGLMARPEYAGLARWLRDAEPRPDVVAPVTSAPAAVAEPRGRGNKARPAKRPQALPMPPLSEGAVAEAAVEEAAPKRKWKAPKPIWGV